jgi:hypothetical protein
MPDRVLALVAEVFASRIEGRRSLCEVTLRLLPLYLIHVVLVYCGLLKFNNEHQALFQDAKIRFNHRVRSVARAYVALTINSAEPRDPQGQLLHLIALGATINMGWDSDLPGVCATSSA